MSNEVLKVSDSFLTSSVIETAIHEVLKAPQAVCDVSHFFGPGVYIREARVSAGIMAIGQIHKTSCTNVFIKGKMLMVQPDGSTKELCAPMTFVSPPGRNVAYITEDIIFQNIYATDETDVEKLEEMLLDKNDELIGKNDENKSIIDHSEDINDYNMFLNEIGMTEGAVRYISENMSDHVKLPFGSYKFAIFDSKIQGKGLFASANIEEGEVIGVARIGNCRTPIGRFTNHSKTPNAYPRLNSQGGIDLVAKTCIMGSRGGLDGEEITVDYRQSRVTAEKLDRELSCLHLSVQQ